MGRSIYSGNLTIGMFSIPVSVYKSFDVIALEGNHFHAECDGKIREKRFCEEHPDEECPEVYSGIPLDDVILRVDSEIRNQVLDRKTPISVVSMHRNTVLKELISSGDLVIMSTFKLRPNKSGSLSHEVINHGGQMFALLMDRLRVNQSFLLVQMPLLGINRYCAITQGGSILAFAYDSEIREYPNDEYSGPRENKKNLDDLLLNIQSDVFPTSFSGEEYERRIAQWSKQAYRIALKMKERVLASQD